MTCEINKLQIKISPRGQACPQSSSPHLIRFIYCLQLVLKGRPGCIELLCPCQLFTCRWSRSPLVLSAAYVHRLLTQLVFTCTIGLVPSTIKWLCRGVNVRRDIFSKQILLNRQQIYVRVETVDLWTRLQHVHGKRTRDPADWKTGQLFEILLLIDSAQFNSNP